VYADTCLLGPDGTPLVADESGCVQLPPPCLLDYNGDPIVPDENGCVQLPTDGAPPPFGCGLRMDDDELAAATSATDYGDLTTVGGSGFDGDSFDGAAVYCDDDGELRTVPDHTARTGGAGVDTLFDGLEAVIDTYTTSAGSLASLTNDSPARAMLVRRFLTATVDVITPGTGLALVRLQERVNGGAWSTVRDGYWPALTSGSASIRYRGQLSSTRNQQIAAGDTFTVQLRVQVVESGADPNYPVLVTAVASSSLLGVTV
jgi:hypothetical protein